MHFAQKCCSNIKKIAASLTQFPRYSSSSAELSSRFSSGYPHPIIQSIGGSQHWFKNWQKLRKNKLTASTFSQAVGFFHKRRVQLWLEKIGAIEPFSGNLAACWSNIHERDALARYKRITKNIVYVSDFQVYQNREDDWLAASPDGFTVERYCLSYGGALEIKCPYFKGDMTNATPWKRIPIHYVPQAQGLMEILDRDWIHIYCWTKRGTNVGTSLFRMYRDEEYWKLLNIALSDFWWNHVQPAKEVCERSAIINPLVELSSYKPEPQHELFRLIMYESRRVLDNSTLIMREIDWKRQN